MSRFIFLQCKEKTNRVTNTSFIILHSTKSAENVENHNSFGIVLIKIVYYMEEAGVGGIIDKKRLRNFYMIPICFCLYRKPVLYIALSFVKEQKFLRFRACMKKYV